MPLESANTISGLDESYPLGGDFTVQGDNHLRLIKSVLKAQFPGSLGQGYAVPITATEADLNNLTGSTSNIQGQINTLDNKVSALENTLSAPVGTVMVFYQATPPVGWVQIFTHNNSMLRMVTSAGGGTGGTRSPININQEHIHATKDLSLIESQIPGHDHHVAINVISADVLVGNNYLAYSFQPSHDDAYVLKGHSSPPTVGRTSLTGGSAIHNHGVTEIGGTNWDSMYIDVITATKS